MAGRKFSIRDKVRFMPGALERVAAPGRYEVVRLLPMEAGEFSYRIKSQNNSYERVAKESQLSSDD